MGDVVDAVTGVLGGSSGPSAKDIAKMQAAAEAKAQAEIDAEKKKEAERLLEEKTAAADANALARRRMSVLSKYDTYNSIMNKTK